MNRHDGIRAVVLAREQHSYFRVLGFLLQLLHLRGKVRYNVFTLLGEFGKSFEILNVPLQARVQFDVLFQPAALLQDCLRFFLVIPELRVCYFLFELENLCTLVFRIKDNLESGVSSPLSHSLSHEVHRAFKILLIESTIVLVR